MRVEGVYEFVSVWCIVWCVYVYGVCEWCMYVWVCMECVCCVCEWRRMVGGALVERVVDAVLD